MTTETIEALQYAEQQLKSLLNIAVGTQQYEIIFNYLNDIEAIRQALESMED